MSPMLKRLLRVRRLMEEMSRAEFAHRRAEQTELETRREEAHETTLALRVEARVAMSQAGAEQDADPGLWQRYLADSESSAARAEQWNQAAQEAAERTGDAERKYLDDRRSRMQAEILLREKMAVERMNRERREQRELDDWFVMGHGRRTRSA